VLDVTPASAEPAQPGRSVDRDLLAILFGPPEDPVLLPDRCREPANARLLVDTAIAWGVAPALRHRLRSLPDGWPASTATWLDQVARLEVARSLALTASGAAALAALLEAGIAAAGFKGMALVSRRRGLPQRSMSDVDLLVSDTSLPQAIAVLTGAGFTLAIPGPLHEYVDFIRKAPHFSGNLAVPLLDVEGSRGVATCRSIDLHWGFGRMCGPALQPAAVLARSVAGRVFGKAVRTVSRTDGLLLAAHHAIRENFTPTAVVKNLLDIAALADDPLDRVERIGPLDRVERIEPRGGPLDRVERIEPLDASVLAGAGTPAVALGVCARILSRWNPGSEALEALRSLAEASPSTRSRTGRDLQALFENQIDAPPVNRDLVHLLHPGSLLDVLRTGLLHPRRNRRLMAVFRDVPGRERLWRLVADLLRSRGDDLRLYRTLARVKRAPPSESAS
jgi:hypothetical protein